MVRCAGILLHPTSLPGGEYNGELGADAYRFVDWLKEAGFSVWQILPLGPTHSDGSPYQSLSVHAGNPLLISFSLLREKGWLSGGELDACDLDELHVAEQRRRQLAHAFMRFRTIASREEVSDWKAFCIAHAAWLDDYGLYVALKAHYQQRAWCDWPTPLRDRDPEAVAKAKAELATQIEIVRFEQYLFFSQWLSLKQYANSKGIRLIGDLPIFVAHDSADVWVERGYFLLDSDGQPYVVAGVPPDYFSETGQRWGNPLYDWARMAADGYAWWLTRMRTQLVLHDEVRIDHFRGFEAYWEIPQQEKTAINGRWIPGPGAALFIAMQKEFGENLPVIAEDLGLITPEVIALRDQFKLPGMKILQFAFEGGASNPYLPHNYVHNSVVYTGTHDNNTSVGWFNSLSNELRQHVLDYLGDTHNAMPWSLIRCASASVADLCILPMQDVLGLGGSHRMNTPGTTVGNWHWRFEWNQVGAGLAERLRELNHLYGR